MKTGLILIFTIFTLAASAQTKLGYYREAQGSFIYTGYKVTASDMASAKISGVSFDLRINYSLLGRLIFSDPEKKFFIGDHIGVGFGVGYFKKTNDDVPYMVPFNLELGLKSCYAVNDDLEVGVKFMWRGLNYFTDFKNDFQLSQAPAIIPSARFKKYMGSIGFGKSKTGDGDAAGAGNYFMIEGRLLFGDMDDESKLFLFLRAENYSGKYDETSRKDRASQVSIGIGIM